MFSACGTNRLSDPRALHAVRNTKVFDNINPSQYHVVQRVEGVSCGKTWADLSSDDDAIQDLKANTKNIQDQIDGITNIICENTGWSWIHNCNNSVTCYADAIIRNDKNNADQNKSLSAINEFSSKCDDNNPKACYLAGSYLYKENRLEDSIFYFQQSCLLKFSDSCELAREIMKEKCLVK